MANGVPFPTRTPTAPKRSGLFTAIAQLQWRDAFAIATPATLLIGLAAHDLGAFSFWRDEVSSVVFASAPLQDLLAILGRNRSEVGLANMATYYVVLHFWLGLGETEATIRFLSVLAGAATLVPIYLVARRFLGWQSGVLAGLVFAANSFVVISSRDARAYSMAMLATATLTWLLVRATERSTPGRWAAYGLVAAIGLYVHFFIGFVLTAHAVWVVVTHAWPRTIPALAAVVIPIVVAAAPIPFVWMAHPSATQWINPLNPTGIYHALMAIVGGPLLALACAVAVAAAVLAHRRNRFVWLVLATFAIPILAAGLVSIAKPVFLARYLVAFVPALAMLVGIGLASFKFMPVRVGAILGLAVLLAIAVPATYRDRHREDWRAASSWIAIEAIAGDKIVYDRTGERQVTYYLKRFDALHPPSRTTLEAVLTGTAQSRVWIVLSGTPPTAERERLSAAVEGTYRIRLIRGVRGAVRVLLLIPESGSATGTASGRLGESFIARTGSTGHA